MEDISTSTTSPAFRNNAGSLVKPTPAGVPVAIMSPGCRVIARGKWAIISATLKIMLDDLTIYAGSQFELLRIRTQLCWDDTWSHRGECVDRLPYRPLTHLQLQV